MNKLKFIKGLKKITLAILFAFTGPVLIYMSFQNKGHDFYYYVLSIGLIISGLSILLGFSGISNLTNGLLNKPKKKTDN